MWLSSTFAKRNYTVQIDLDITAWIDRINYDANAKKLSKGVWQVRGYFF